METLILSIIRKYGYIGVFFLIALENIFPPIPSEIILLFGGFSTSEFGMNLFIMILVSTLGSLLGAFALYYIGSILNKDKLKKIVDAKIFRIFKIETKDIDKADAWFTNKGIKAVFICRFIPIVRSLISIPAGMNKMDVIKFGVYTLAGSLVWNIALLITGNIVGENWRNIATIFDKYSKVILISIIFFLIIVISCFYFNKARKKEQ